MVQVRPTRDQRFSSLRCEHVNGERCKGVSEKTTMSVRAHGLPKTVRDSEAVRGFEHQQSIAHNTVTGAFIETRDVLGATVQ